MENRLLPTRFRRHFFFVSVLSLSLLATTCLAPNLLAQAVDLHVEPDSAALGSRIEPPPLRLVENTEIKPLTTLPPALDAAQGRVDAIRAWNEAGRLPARIGFSRPIPVPVTVHLERRSSPSPAPIPHDAGLLARAPDSSTVWGAELHVEDAHRIRIRLSDVRLPPSVRLWVYGQEGAAVGPFGVELVHEGVLWTPSIQGPVARLEVAIPAQAVPGKWLFRIDQVAEILPAAVALPRLTRIPNSLDTSCLIDVQCVNSNTFSVVDLAERAIAHLQFPINNGEFIGVCTGGLLNDTSDSGTPFLLTANHCIADQATATGIEAFWDLKSNSCGGDLPSSVPRSNGATLLATGTASDFTLIELNTIPGNRVFLGWNANPSVLQQGTQVHRIHHPVPEGSIFTQAYSRLEYLPSSFNLCGVDDQGREFDDAQSFHHGRLLEGGSFGGSSGAPIILDGGQVVGQLFGGCGPDPEEGCDDRNQAVDGAFGASFPALEPFLASGDPGDGEPCLPNDTTLCLNGGRFRVQVDWRTSQGTVGEGQTVEVTPTPDDSGLFYFFDPDNWEMLVKVLNGCPITNHYWVFFAATTDVEFTLTVTDTERNEVKQYFNPLGQRANAVTDTSAFATCP